MARNNRNNQNQKQSTKSTESAVNVLEGRLSALQASLNNTAILYQQFDMNLDMDIDEAALKAVVKSVQDDDAKTVGAWFDRFAVTCKELVKLKEQLIQEHDKNTDSLQRIVKELEHEKDRLETLKLTLDEYENRLEEQNSEIEKDAFQQATKNTELLDRERAIKLRELNADTGFAEQNRLALHDFECAEKKIKALSAKEFENLLEQKSQVQIEINHAEKQLLNFQSKANEEEIAKIIAIEKREHEVEQKLRELDVMERRLGRGWSDLKESRQQQQDEFDQAIEIESDAHQIQLSKLEERLKKAHGKSTELKEQLSSMRELEFVLAGQSADSFIAELELLRIENREQRRQLEVSDTADLQQDVDSKRTYIADLERELTALQPKLEEAQRELGFKRISAIELEATAREKRVLEHHQSVLELHINDLESRIDHLTNAQKTQTPFPAMSLMDENKNYRASMEHDEVINLEQFANELQHRIAQAEPNVQLYYPIEDIRVLLGGLAMSKLHVFQGISGTGKTSLAKAFAKAVGGFCTDIAVQAGWRDRDDLLGHYNAFERRFYEKDCLQALYKAQTPRWSDTCNVILLDEINLSRPEQYFAEFLSALEKNNPDERVISLTETELPNVPKLLKDGRKILVPDNVWFIGTANHDETTNELADKTYDRAHVMTLPKQDISFDIKDYTKTSFSFRSLNRAFDNACQQYGAEVADLLDWLAKDELTDQLENTFGLGWGNRFEKQALRFIPVMRAVGSNDGDALDHLLATRVMRQGKVTGRYDINSEAIRNLITALEEFWSGSGLVGVPEKSLELLEKDIKRKEGGF